MPGEPRHDAHEVDRLTRGRPLTDDEIACYIADHQTAIRHGTARVGDEIAEQLRDRLAALPPVAPDLDVETLARAVAVQNAGEHAFRPDGSLYPQDVAVGEELAAIYRRLQADKGGETA